MRISSLLGKIIVLLVICCCCGLPVQAKYGGGTGEPNDPYLIFDANQMNAIGADSNDWDKHFKLMVDIDLDGFTGTEFNIIGASLPNVFRGVFDGNDHTISNFTYTSEDTGHIGLFCHVGGVIKDLVLLNPNVDAGTGSYVGSLAAVARGTISNCYVEGGSVVGGNFVGGLVGDNRYGTISNCYSNASVTGTSNVGGLVGYNRDTITNCYSTGNVSGDKSVGGLVGCNFHGTITNCYAWGDVSFVHVVLSGLGGLVGYNRVGTITDCYATGSVSGEGKVGGLAGYNRDTITNCYSTGSVSGYDRIGGLVGYNDRAAIITNCYSNGGVTGELGVGGLVGYNAGTIANCYATGSVTGTQDTGGLVGSSSGYVIKSYWDVETSGQDVSAGGEGKTTAQMMTASTFVHHWGACGEVWTIDEGVDYPRLAWEEKQGKPIVGVFSLRGEGDSNSPYLIYTPEELNVIGQIPCIWDKHFKLMTDIDLRQLTGTEFNIITNFTGIFDGNGHTISNFIYTSSGTYRIGLFGYVRGVIKDLGLINPEVDAGTGGTVGSLVGSLEDGTISNCYVEGGSVVGISGVGGLVGYNPGGTITNCYAQGSTVSGNYYGAGGLVGGHGGTITNCYVSGSVTGENNVGGLVGEHYGKITNCYTSGSVTGYRNVGGLVGYNEGLFGGGIITNCYSTASVAGGRGLVGVVGYGWGSVTNSFWDIETSGQETSAGGTGKTTAEMQTMSTFTDAGWDFSTPIWKMNCEGMSYPKLSWWQPVLGDYFCPDGIDMIDMEHLALHWLDTGCDETNDYCDWAEISNDSTIDFTDFAILADNWLAGL